MDHSIQYYTFDTNTNKDTIVSEINESLTCKNSSELESSINIKFIESKIHSDISEAYKAIEEIDKGSENLAIQYNHYESVPDTKTIVDLEKRIQKQREIINNYKIEKALRNGKLNLINCTQCGSRISKQYVLYSGYDWNNCPLCGKNLSSNLIKESLSEKNKEFHELRKVLSNEREKNKENGDKTIKWLVKVKFDLKPQNND